MALIDIIADSSNVSAIIEVFTLFFIVAGFFRWYDGKYQKSITGAKNEVVEKIDDVQSVLINRLEVLDRTIMRLEDRFHKHITTYHSYQEERKKWEEEHDFEQE